ncbi:YeiH family protein [Rouxiella sp. T17]|uniref:YeiH family protein n=1 Tax=Rouxiella sp. T17 TaxID=3085684 RepID=UPI002FC84040
MFNLSSPIGRVLPGLVLTLAISGLALWLGNFPAFASVGLSALTMAIALGMVAGNTFFPKAKPRCAEGVNFAKQKLLRLGIILYGFKLTFAQITDVGASGIVIDLLTLSSTFLLACWLGKKVFKLDEHTTLLIGAGSSICGAAAIMATAPVIKAEGEKVTVAVATVVIFGTLAIFLYPWLWQLNLAHHWLTLSETQFGIYSGSTIHEVAQVVAAGHGVSPEAENTAVIAKMIRVMLLAPFLLLLGLWRGRQHTKRVGTLEKPSNLLSTIAIPWFAVGFIIVAAFNSFNLLPATWVQNLLKLDTLLLAMAMAALGLTTHFSALRQAGIKPLLMAGLLFGWLILGGAGINQLVQQLF